MQTWAVQLICDRFSCFETIRIGGGKSSLSCHAQARVFGWHIPKKKDGATLCPRCVENQEGEKSDHS